jgi:protein O-mannosyl-transferase
MSGLYGKTYAWFRRWRFPVILVLATIIAYFPAWRGQPVWDDDAHLTRVDLRSLHGLSLIWSKPGAVRQYYPVVHTIFWIENRFWGDNWIPYHLLSVALHALSAVLLWRILVRLQIPLAGLAATIFALHPLQVESVAWMSELKNTLSGVCFLTAALIYLRFDETRRRRLYWIALAVFVIGLLSKSVIAMLPVALFLTLWWKRPRLEWKRDIAPLIPFLVIGIASGLFTAWVETTYIGARGRAFDLSIVDRALIVGRTFWFYAFKFIWPVKLTFIYPRWVIDAASPGQYLFPLGLFILFVILWSGRQAGTKGALVACLFFAALLFPASGLLNVYPFKFSFVANHFQYLAQIGLSVLAASATGAFIGRYRLNSLRRPLVLVVGLILFVLTWRDAKAFTDPITLYNRTLEENPDCWMAHGNLGVELLQQGRADEGINHLVRALTIQPDNAEAHTNLANALIMIGRYADAISHYQSTLALAPDAIPPRNNLAWLLATCPELSLRNGAEAVRVATPLIQMTGGKDPVVLRTVAAAFAENEQFAEAVQAASAGLELARAEGSQSSIASLEHDLRRYQAQRKPSR